jgi:hypothetical protein
MQTSVRQLPATAIPAGARDDRVPAGEVLLLGCQVLLGLALLFGVPVLVALLDGARVAVFVAIALLVILIAFIRRIGVEFERAWLLSEGNALQGDDGESERRSTPAARPTADCSSVSRSPAVGGRRRRRSTVR